LSYPFKQLSNINYNALELKDQIEVGTFALKKLNPAGFYIQRDLLIIHCGCIF